MRTGCGSRGNGSIRTSLRFPPTAGALGRDSSRRQTPRLGKLPELDGLGFSDPAFVPAKPRLKRPASLLANRPELFGLFENRPPLFASRPVFPEPRLRAGANGAPPLTMPARARSPESGRTKELRPTPVRPKSAARRPVTAPLKRALRYTFTMLVLLTTVP